VRAWLCVCVCVLGGGGQLTRRSRAGELAVRHHRVTVACVDALTRSRGDVTRNVSLYVQGHEKSSLRDGHLIWARGVDSTSHLARDLPAHHSPCARGAPPHACQTSTGDDCPQSHTAASQRAPLCRQESTPMHSVCVRTQRVAHRCLEQSSAQRMGERGWRRDTLTILRSLRTLASTPSSCDSRDRDPMTSSTISSCTFIWEVGCGASDE
jgi:hypothetical protein